VQIFKDFIQTAGQGGATAAQLGQIAQALGLIDAEAADAMLRVSLLDGALKNIDLAFQAGQIETSEVDDAIKGVIAQIEDSENYADLTIQIRASVSQAQAEVERELRLPEEDRTRQINVGANMTAADRALAQTMGLITGSSPELTIDADDSPARRTLESVVNDINERSATLDIYGEYHPPADMPQTGGGGRPPTTPGNPQPFAVGGYVQGARGAPVAALVHAGEYVMRPEAVDRLGVGFLEALNRGVAGSASNNVTVQTNIYGPVGAPEARQIVVTGGQTAADELKETLRRSGYQL
jgi:hypothetical protein